MSPSSESRQEQREYARHRDNRSEHFAQRDLFLEDQRRGGDDEDGHDGHDGRRDAHVARLDGEEA